MFWELARLRKTDEVFSRHGREGLEGAVLSDRALVLRFFGRTADRLLVVNFGADLLFAPAPAPLLAPMWGRDWELIFSTDDPQYGGGGIADVRLPQGWRLPAEAALVFAPKSGGSDDGRTGSQNRA